MFENSLRNLYLAFVAFSAVRKITRRLRKTVEYNKKSSKLPFSMVKNSSKQPSFI